MEIIALLAIISLPFIFAGMIPVVAVAVELYKLIRGQKDGH